MPRESDAERAAAAVRRVRHATGELERTIARLRAEVTLLGWITVIETVALLILGFKVFL